MFRRVLLSASALLTFLLPTVFGVPEICDGTIICPAGVSDTYFLPHPTDCSKSYKCRNGNPMIYTCPGDELFSVDQQKCVDPSEVVCTRRCITPPEPEPECDVVLRCPLGSSSYNFLPHPGDCRKSYRCKQDKPIVYTCPEGEHFSEEEQKCVDASKVVCTRSCSQTPVVPLSPEEGCASTECPATNGDVPIYLAHNDCTKFCVCDNGNIRVIACPSPLYYNIKLKVCDWPTNAGCIP